jgi:ubiquinone/menaquinone biosynthesis C-methylase UbiE
LTTASPQYPGGLSKFQVSLSEAYGEKWSALLEEKNFAEFIVQHLENRHHFYDLIQRYLTEVNGQRILELGCGTGIDINVIAKEKKSSKCFGSDISPQSIKVCEHITKIFSNEIELFVADTQRLPLKAQTFDLVFSQGLVEHFEDPEAVIAEQVRVLREGGILIVNVPQKYTGYTLMKKRAMKKGKWKLGWESEFSYSNLKRIGKRLALIEKDVLGYQYWKSWREPVFVLRDLYNKLHRRNPLRNHPLFLRLTRCYESFWRQIENRWGQYFLQNIVIVYEKPSR